MTVKLALCFAIVIAATAFSAAVAQPDAPSQAHPASKYPGAIELTIDGAPPDTMLAGAKIESMSLPLGKSWRKDGMRLDELRLALTIGAPFSVALRHGSENWRIDGSVDSCCDDTIVVDAALTHDGETARKYSLIVRQGELATLSLDGTNSIESVSDWVGNTGSEPAKGPGMRFMFRVDEHLRGPIPGVSEVGYRHMTRIEYPASAIADRSEGVVYIGVHVAADGTVVNAKVDNVLPVPRADLADAALAAVKTWTFDPLVVDDKTAAGDTTVAIAFSLDPDKPLAVLPGVLNPVRVSPPQDDESAASVDEPASEKARYRQLQPPKYPVSAIKAHEQGRVVLRVHLDEKGNPIEAFVDKTDPPDLSPELGDAAIAAVMQWQFNPAHNRGKTVGTWVNVPIDFHLKEL
jgi:TonB family protein